MKSTKGKKKAAELRRRRLKAAMVRRGIVGRQVARDLGVTPMSVYHVTSGRKRIRRVIQRLVELGIPESFFQEVEYGQVGMAAACVTGIVGLATGWGM